MDSLIVYENSSLPVHHRISFSAKEEVRVKMLNEIDQPLQILYQIIPKESLQSLEYLTERAIALSRDDIEDTLMITDQLKIWIRPLDDNRFILRMHNRGEDIVELKPFLNKNRAIFLEKLIRSEFNLFVKAISETNLSGIELWDDSQSYRDQYMKHEPKRKGGKFQDFGTILKCFNGL